MHLTLMPSITRKKERRAAPPRNEAQNVLIIFQEVRPALMIVSSFQIQ